MTFAIAAFCAREDKLGICQSTSTPAVGNRYARVVPGQGAVVVQAMLGFRTIDTATALLAAGTGSKDILKALEAADPEIDRRQIAIVRAGDVASRPGPGARHWAGAAQGKDFVALGNVVVGPQVVEAMREAFESSSAMPLEERLLRAIEAGRDAGGEASGQSSSVLTVSQGAFPLVDLRVDMNPEPIGELRRLFDWYKPLMPYYVRRNQGGPIPPWRDFLTEQKLPLVPPGWPA